MILYNFISKEHALNLIGDQRIEVSRIDDLNDRFELHAMDLSDKRNREEFVTFKFDMAKKIGSLCFSKSWKCPLLWSHYANRHKGIALEFEVANQAAHPVKYKGKGYSYGNQNSIRTETCISMTWETRSI
jgi:hypothetical protein